MITLTIPAPCEFINTNKRYNRFFKADLTKQWRTTTGLLAKQQELPAMDSPVRIIAHIWKPRGGRYDPNNWADTTKACVDGLVDAGMLPDDSHREVIGPDHRHGGKGEPAIVLTIVPLPVENDCD